MPDVAHISLNDQVLDIKDSSARVAARIYTNVVCIGDSFLSGTGCTNPSTDNWGAQMCAQMGVTNFRLYGNPNAGFINPGVSPAQTFVQMVSAGGSVYNAEHNTATAVDCVVCMGCINDNPGSTAQMVTAVETFVAAAKSLFPNADIFLAPSSTMYPRPLQKRLGVMEGGQKSGAFVINSAHWLYNYENNFDNNIHPNTTASAVLGYLMAAAVKGRWYNAPRVLKNKSQNGCTLYWWADNDFFNIILTGSTSGQISGGDLFTNLPLPLKPQSNRVIFPVSINAGETVAMYFYNGDNGPSVHSNRAASKAFAFNPAYIQLPIWMFELTDL